MNRRDAILYVVLTALIVFLMLGELVTGSSGIPWTEIPGIIADPEAAGTAGVIIVRIRLPRLIAAAVLGGGLSLSGYLLQAFFANPIAGPFVLGISSGAKLVVALLMVAATQYGFLLTSGMMILAALAGSLAATGFVIIAAGRVRSMSILIVCGVMVGYICSAITELIIAFADDTNIVNIHNWSMGSFASTSWDNIAVMTPVILAGLVFSLFLAKDVEAYLYGEGYAFSLGISVRRFRVMLILCSSVLSATVTAFAGPVSFVGIAVPHVIRRVFRTSKPVVMMTASFLGGSAFCLFCDLLARSLFAPTELSISTITAIFGAPIVISMLLGRKKG